MRQLYKVIKQKYMATIKKADSDSDTVIYRYANTMKVLQRLDRQ